MSTTNWITAVPRWAYQRRGNITKTSWCIIGWHILSLGVNTVPFIGARDILVVALTTMVLLLFPLLIGGYLMERKSIQHSIPITIFFLVTPLIIALYINRIEFVAVGAGATWLLLVRRWNTFLLVAIGLAILSMGATSGRSGRREDGVINSFTDEAGRLENHRQDEWFDDHIGM